MDSVCNKILIGVVKIYFVTILNNLKVAGLPMPRDHSLGISVKINFRKLLYVCLL